ncbi:MAG: RND transporter [Candidatus Binatia bacterium]|nr:MAG: RND transporter [Candidatus Binatia bacterium]
MSASIPQTSPRSRLFSLARHRVPLRRCRALFAASVLVSASLACTRQVAPSEAGGVAVAEDLVEVPAPIQERMKMETVVVRETEVSEPITAPARLSFNERYVARVGVPIEGRVQTIFVQVGDRVANGQMLAVIQSPTWEAAVARLRTTAAEERSARAELAFAIQQRSRVRRLFGAQAASRMEVERTALDLIVARNKLHAARAELAKARRDVTALAGDSARLDFAGLPLRSPLSGLVVERSASPGFAVVPGTPLFVVADPSHLWLQAEVDERWLSRLATGLRVEFRVAAYPEITFTGTVDYIGASLNPKTRRVELRCTVDNADGKLKPEMFAQLEIPDPQPRRILIVPDSAVQELDGKNVVFVPAGENRFRRHAVEIGRTGDGWIEVKSGLKNGDRVVGRGSFLLKSTLALRAHPPED